MTGERAPSVPPLPLGAALPPITSAVPAHRLDDECRDELTRIDSQNLRRTLRPMVSAGPSVTRGGLTLANLASNDYLGLSQHPKLIAAARDATAQYGVGAGASRLVAGHFEVHERAERGFTAFKTGGRCDKASLLLPTGYMANLAVLTTLAEAGDLICLDKLCHASLIDAARMSGAEVRVFPHLEYAKLERLLTRADDADRKRGVEAARARRIFVVTDSVFSMDGDVADLARLCDLADRFGAILVVDEAHGTGLLGAAGTGLVELQGVSHRVPITISTASKALGGIGGIVTASKPVIDLLVNRARPFLYTTGVPPATAAVLSAAIELVQNEPWRRERVLAWSTRLRAGLTERGWGLPPTSAVTPIIPLITGNAAAAVALAQRLQDAGLLGVAIRPPTVAPGAARVRLSLRSDLDDDIVDHVLRAVGVPVASSAAASADR